MVSMIFRLRLRNMLLALLGSAVLAFGLYNIHSISDITEGGVLGLTLFLEHWCGISPAISGFVLNALCYFFAWRCLGNSFIGYSIIASGGFSLFYAIFEKFPPLFPGIAVYPLVAAVLGAVFVGVGVGLSVRAGGAPTGDDAVAMSLSKLFRMRIKWAYLISDLTVLLLSASYIPLIRLAFSLLTVCLSGQIIDLLQRFKNDEKEIEDSFEERDVLVGTLRNTAQLKTCLSNNFYHIPAIRLHPGDFPIRYIAIYQSNHKFGSDSGIVYYGEVTKTSVVRRNEITEIPKDSTELYYRFDIKEWKTLSEKISSDGDFVNLSTNLFLLTHAKSTAELSLLTAEEFELYQNTRRLISGEISEIVSGNHSSTLRCDGEQLIVSRRKKEVFSCSVSDFKSRKVEIFRYIWHELK